jgi:hypothetical protein
MGYMVFFITTVIYQNQVFYFIFLKITGIKTKTHPDIQWGLGVVSNNWPTTSFLWFNS